MTLSIINKHVPPHVPKVFGNRRSEKGRIQPHERRLVARRHDHDRAGQALRTEIPFEKLADFTTPLADQHDHVDVGRAGLRHLAQERALSDAAAGENSQSLPLAARQKGVDHADARAERGIDPRPSEGRRRRAV